MRIQQFTLDRTERVSPFFAPAGRRAEVQMHVLPTALATGRKAADTLQLIVEQRLTREDEFIEMARTEAVSMFAESVLSIEVPALDPMPESGQPLPVYRVRVVHEGDCHPRYDVKVLGL